MSKKRILLAAVTGAAAAAWLMAQRLRPRQSPLRRAGQQATALITGASSGIGGEFARQLAGHGYDLVLVARRADRLQALAGELAAAYGVKVDVLPADLSTPEGVATVEDRIRQMDTLEVLVNNAGFATIGHLVDVEPRRQQEMVYLHVMATMRLSQAALPQMVERGRGAMVNVSSIASFMAMPGNVNYNATKAYINVFSQALQTELRGKGVFVQALCPGFTHTEFHATEDFAGFDKSKWPAFMWMDVGDVVRASLNDLGSGDVIFVPGMVNRFLAGLARTPVVGPALMQAV